MTLVLAAFLAAAYLLVQRALIQAGTDRAQATAVQVAAILAQSTELRRADVQRIASDAAIRSFVKAPAGPDRDAAWRLLDSATIPGQQSVALWANARQAAGLPDRLLSSNEDGWVLPEIDAPSRVGVSALRVTANTVYYDVVAAVADEPLAVNSPADRSHLGYVVMRRAVSAPQTSSILGGLVGKGARLELGNRDGRAWTDWSAVVSAPPVDLTRAGATGYRGPEGSVVGSLAPVAGTSWLLWVELSQEALLGPARALLRPMLAAALACVVVGALLCAVVSERITSPLHSLTIASEAIVAGDYTRRVSSRRRDEIGRLAIAFNAMSAHFQVAREELEARVQSRTVELESAVKQLEAFSYSVSHDLRAPLRHLVAYSELLQKEASSSLDDKSRRYMQTILQSAKRMGNLIDDLLAFSRVGRAETQNNLVSLEQLVKEVVAELRDETNGREVAWKIGALPVCYGDRSMLKLVLANLVSNAVKFTRMRARAEIEIGCLDEKNKHEVEMFVRDNGAVFDMQYVDKLFGVFQRLHLAEQFEGNGIGLATVQRIIHRHGGKVRAEGAVDQGATFYFSLPNAQDAVERIRHDHIGTHFGR